jgi:hypothetical protein
VRTSTPISRRDAARRAELAQLVRRVEPVARLDLDRRHAFGRQRSETRPALRDELVVARGAGRADGGLDPAPGSRDLRVRRAVEARFELVDAIARIHEMRVAIDETGRRPRAARIERASRRRVARQSRSLPTHAIVSPAMPMAPSRIAPYGVSPPSSRGARR